MAFTGMTLATHLATGAEPPEAMRTLARIWGLERGHLAKDYADRWGDDLGYPNSVFYLDSMLQGKQ